MTLLIGKKKQRLRISRLPTLHKFKKHSKLKNSERICIKLPNKAKNTCIFNHLWKRFKS